MGKAGLILGIWMGIYKVVLIIHKVISKHIVAKEAVGQRAVFKAGIHTGLVQRNRVKGGKHTHVRQNGNVVCSVAVTLGRNVPYNGYMEAGTTIHNSLCILSHAAVKLLNGGILSVAYRVKVAGGYTATTAHAGLGVYVHFSAFRVKHQTVIGTLLHAELAATAFLFGHKGLAIAVLGTFTGSGAAAHTDILYSAAKAC